MSRASYNNQARVHNGYHYPRSILTGLRSRASFPRFVDEFEAAVVDDFRSYYLIANVLGKVTARQFKVFCERIGAPCEPAPSHITEMTQASLVEAAFEVVEHAFDAVRLRSLMLERIHAAGVELLQGCEVTRVQPGEAGLVAWAASGAAPSSRLGEFRHVFNCTYSRINALNAASGVAQIPLKHEMTEMCLVEMPQNLRQCAFTVMCGPFFSFMPFPSRGLHSFSHVRYTPHYEWTEGVSPNLPGVTADSAAHGRTAWPAMWRDAMRYMPGLAQTRYVDSLWEVKTILPRSESDDSRPILFVPDHGMPGLHTVMGGKIDNVYEVAAEIERRNMLG